MIWRLRVRIRHRAETCFLCPVLLYSSPYVMRPINIPSPSLRSLPLPQKLMKWWSKQRSDTSKKNPNPFKVILFSHRSEGSQALVGRNCMLLARDSMVWCSWTGHQVTKLDRTVSGSNETEIKKGQVSSFANQTWAWGRVGEIPTASGPLRVICQLAKSMLPYEWRKRGPGDGGHLFPLCFPRATIMHLL